MKREPYGTTRDGQQVEQFTLRNKKGVEVRCINYGCRLTHLLVPDRHGKPGDILLGYDDLAGFEDDITYMGAFIGRFAGRMKGAAFELGGHRYNLTKNDGENYLHGSFHHTVFSAEPFGDHTVAFTYTSPDGEDGFPGDVWVSAVYTLTDENELVMDFRAVAKADTVVNLTNHAYFNLSAGQQPDVHSHNLWLGCSRFVEAGPDLCPTGRLPETAGGAFDFTAEKPIGRDIGNNDPQLAIGGGYDHCFVIDRLLPDALVHAATASEPESGRVMRVYTTQPGLVFYSGNFLQGTPGKGGRPMQKHSGFCLETQHFPSSPHFPDFPSTVLHEGEKFHHVTALHFGCLPD